MMEKSVNVESFGHDRKVSEPATDFDSDLTLSESSSSHTESSDMSLDPAQIQKENPFVPPPPYELVADQKSETSQSNRSGPQSQQPPLTGSLNKPIAIPATSHKLGSPFLRAYAPVLEKYQLSDEEFLKFIDELNRTTVKSPPFRVLSLAGQIVGFVPVDIAQAVGAGVQLAAGVGAAAVSKGRTEIMMRDANRTIFAPRGLKCEIAKLDAVAKLAGIPILDDKGNIVSSSALFPKADPDDAEQSKDDAGKVMIMQRRLNAFDGYIAPLQLSSLPVLAAPDNPLAKWNVRASEREREVAERKMIKKSIKEDRRLPAEERVAVRYDKKIARKERKLEKAIATDGIDSKRVEKKMEKLERKREKLDLNYDRKLEKATSKDNKETKMQKRARKGLWLIIRSLDAE